MRVFRTGAGAVLVGACVVLAGCATRGSMPGAGEPYPAQLERTRTLDIQVFRRDTKLELTNTTATRFGPSRIWLNGWNSRPIDGLAIGETLELPLSDFRDEYGEAFRSGGFFATELPEQLVLAELEVETPSGERILMPMVVIGQ